ncbi:MAG TPA: FeoA family protein [Desulfosalsimonadaceae bacterium]|nr:FeoA family protein [Desulfosalsimonadaceae bacterium]
MRLSDMREGDTGKIISIGGEPRLRRRILEMGLTKGSDIYIEKYAPLKDPMELIIKDFHVSLRVKEAAEIQVAKETQEGPYAEKTA